nr:MAG TPA: hypothetical protein [Caudoviricetes sp.]
MYFYRYPQEESIEVKKSHYHLTFDYHLKNGNIL